MVQPNLPPNDLQPNFQSPKSWVPSEGPLQTPNGTTELPIDYACIVPRPATTWNPVPFRCQDQSPIHKHTLLLNPQLLLNLLLPATALPVGHLYLLSNSELTILREYLDDSLRKGLVIFSKCRGHIFGKKKEGTLHPFVDYQGRNKITIKNSYPLPLIPQLMEQLQVACIFTKLDLRKAYILNRIQEGGWVEYGFLNPIWTICISCHALRFIQSSCYFSGFQKQYFLGFSGQLCGGLPGRYFNVLQFLNRSH